MQSKGLSGVFSNTTVQKHQFFSAQLSLWSNSLIHTRPREPLGRSKSVYRFGFLYSTLPIKVPLQKAGARHSSGTPCLAALLALRRNKVDRPTVTSISAPSVRCGNLCRPLAGIPAQPLAAACSLSAQTLAPDCPSPPPTFRT